MASSEQIENKIEGKFEFYLINLGTLEYGHKIIYCVIFEIGNYPTA